MKDKKIELLAPAGDLEKLKWAVLYGADAVYRAQHHSREEHDAQTDGKRTEHREYVYRFGSRQLSYAPI